MRPQKMIVLCICLMTNIFFVDSQENHEIHFSLLSQDDNIIFLKEKDNKSTYEQLKFVAFGDQSYLSFGGGYRFQVENFINENFTDQDGQDNIWYLNRIMLHSLFELDNKLEVFAELNSSTVINKEDVSPVDKDILSVNQLFVKYHFDPRWSLLVGRENLKLGSRRLIDIREGPNVRRSFDLVSLTYNKYDIKLMGFFGIPVRQQEGVFDNKALKFDETLTGIYLTASKNPKFSYDYYGLFQKKDKVTYQSGTNNQNRYTIGTRVFGVYKNFSYNNEVAYQFGSFGESNISAYTLSIQGELEYPIIADKTVFGMKTELISGDKTPNDKHLNTFDALYPRGAYFGRVARFGPANLIDVHPYVNIYKSDFYLLLDYDAFWRYSNTDGVYNAPLQLQYPSLNAESFIANQFGALLGFDVNNHLNIELETNIIVPGNFLKRSALTATLFHAVLTTEFKF